MNKLQKKHYQIIECENNLGYVDVGKVAIKSAELTEEISIEFLNWFCLKLIKQDNSLKGLNSKQKFSEFLKSIK